MKIRMGFITNSSSTNFLIISKEELSEEYLFEKLGFKKGGVLEKQGKELCNSIMNAVNKGLRHYNYNVPDYDTIKEVFGDKSAHIFLEKEGFHTYWGNTHNDDSPIVEFFTTDCFEIIEDDFYVNGKACSW